MEKKLFNWLKNLNTDKSNPWPVSVKNQAPHKALLILSVIDGVQQGWIKSNTINISSELQEAFFGYWEAIMGKERNTKISTPFKHLDHEPFWDLYDNKTAIVHENLYQEMADIDSYEKLREILLSEYFSPKTASIINDLRNISNKAWDYSGELTEMISKPFIAFRNEKDKRKNLFKNQQAREAGFSIFVRGKYDFSCSVCRNRVVTPTGKSLVDGAHIIPWTNSYNDDPRNGISLCKSHHWMFDNMMLTIRQDYTIKISDWLSYEDNLAHETIRLRDKSILLPEDQNVYPALEALEDHNKRFEQYHQENL
jgi:putative restriction endonuclease